MEASPAPAPSPQVLRPLAIGELLDVAIKIYRRHAGALLRIGLYVILPIQLIGIAISVATVSDSGTTTTTFDQFGQTTTTTDDSYIVGQVIVSILGALATMIATAASVKAVSEAWLGKTPDWRESLRTATRKLGSLIWLAILSFAVIMGGFIAVVIPGIWVLVPVALAFPALIVEGLTGFKAIRRGARLVRKRWWSTAGAIFLGYLLASVLTFVAAAILGFVLALGSDSDVAFVLATGVSNAAATVLTTPFTAGVVTLAYYDLRVRKEGLDVELLAQGMGHTGSGNSPFFKVGPPQVPQPGSGAAGAPPFWPPPPGWQPPPPPPPQAPASPPGGSAP